MAHETTIFMRRDGINEWYVVHRYIYCDIGYHAQDGSAGSIYLGHLALYLTVLTCRGTVLELIIRYIAFPIRSEISHQVHFVIYSGDELYGSASFYQFRGTLYLVKTE